MKKLLAILLSTAMALSLAGCSNSNGEKDSESTNTITSTGTSTNSSTSEAKLKIGVLQFMEHEALDGARDGFIKALSDNGFVDGENIEIDLQNAQSDQSNLLTMSQRFVNSKSDLVLAIATGAAQSIAAQTKEIPILFTAVTDPIIAGLVNSNELPGENVSGTNDMSPIKEQIELMLKLAPQVKTVGVLYNSSEDNSVLQADMLKEILKEKGLEFIEQTVTSSNDVQQATQAIVSKCDAIYIPTDNTFATAMPIVSEITIKAKVPVICGEEGPVKKGGLATLGLNYFNLGYQTGEMAVRILKGEDVSKMPVESLAKYDYLINAQTAKDIGIEIPEDLQQYAK